MKSDIIVDDALKYLDQVKTQFEDKPEVYNHFLDIMKEFKAQNISTPMVIMQVSSLFDGKPDLILGFNNFLPSSQEQEEAKLKYLRKDKLFQDIMKDIKAQTIDTKGVIDRCLVQRGMKVKASFNGQIWRINWCGKTFANLVQQLSESVPALRSHKATHAITYKDDEGDVITVSSDADLGEAFAVAQQDGRSSLTFAIRETITVNFVRLSGDTTELKVVVAETKTVYDLKKGYEKVYGVGAACQILLNTDVEEGKDEEEVTVEKEMSGLSDELSLAAARISDGSNLLLSINEPPRRELKVEDALHYLDLVKAQFGNQPEVYNQFLDIMKNFKAQTIDTPGVVKRVSTLFKDHDNLVLGFNTFLPQGFKIKPEFLRSHQIQYGNIPAEDGVGDEVGDEVGDRVDGGVNAGPRDDGKPVEIEFDHAIHYVTTIKKRFTDDPNTYTAFLEILHMYQKEQKSIEEVLQQVSQLFRNHSDLLEEFTYFLPHGVQEQAKAQLAAMQMSDADGGLVS
jgi:paired amphipathic helix protein Sin3a